MKFSKSLRTYRKWGLRAVTLLAIALAAGLVSMDGPDTALGQEARQGSPAPGGGSVATITSGVTASALAAAMDIDPGDLKSASIGTSDSAGVATGDSSLGIPKFKVTGSTYAILATGLAVSADDPNSAEDTSAALVGLDNSQGNDLVQLTLVLNVPQAATCATFDFAFFSDEYPEFVGTEFNDGFIAEVGTSTFTIAGTQIVAPNNIAFDPTDSTVVDVSSSLAFHPPSAGYVPGHTATGTTYDGATDLLQAATPVAGGGSLTLIFSITDLGDSIFDSAVFLDNFQFGTQGPATCQPGAQQPVGGLAVDLDGEQAGLPLDVAQSPGGNAGSLAALIAGISAAAIAMAGVAWYARRRLL